jgi:hypothetical protein
MTKISKKKILEKAVKLSLEKAITEIHITNIDFSEEALRYIVMLELSNFSIFGTFPNNNSNAKLIFEKKYNRNKVKKNKSFYPDISSISDSNKLLAVELKIAKPSSKFDLTDINKCKEYIDLNKGKESYELAASIYAAPYFKTWHSSLHESLNYRLDVAKKQGMNINNSQILIAYIKWEEKINGIIPKAKVITGWI